jgi:hypothetical protein
MDSQLDSLCKLGTASTNRKHSTRLPLMEVSITVKPSMENDWISASESLLE